jgi:hypothetical protein
MEVLYLRCGRLDIHQKLSWPVWRRPRPKWQGRLTAADLRLDTLAVGAHESVRDVHAGHERAAAIRTGHVTIEATWPKFRPSLPRGLTLAKTVLANCGLVPSASLSRFSWALRGS